jgi:hypothetical protein
MMIVMILILIMMMIIIRVKSFENKIINVKVGARALEVGHLI